MSGVTSGGGGGVALHTDGDPVSVQLAIGESVTVPAGETWVVTAIATEAVNAAATALLSGSQAVVTAPQETTNSVDAVFTGGTNLSCTGDGQYDENGATVSGWSL